MPSYLAIPGITGDSVAARHESEIEIDTWSFSCSLATGAFGTGARANRPDLTALTLTCRSGSASPRLLEYCATGRALPQAVLTHDRGAGSAATEVRLTDVRVTGYTVTGAGDAMTDEFRLGFGTVAFTVRVPRPDGSLGDPVTTTQPAPGSPVPSPGSGGVWRPR